MSKAFTGLAGMAPLAGLAAGAGYLARKWLRKPKYKGKRYRSWTMTRTTNKKRKLKGRPAYTRTRFGKRRNMFTKKILRISRMG